MLSPGVGPLLQQLKQLGQQRNSPRIIAGVITNSDDRVPGILSALGLRVSPLRFGSSIDPVETASQQYDVDLHCMSYDVGSTKPDRRIFDAAEYMANQLLAAQTSLDLHQDSAQSGGETVRWLKVFVGDEYENDVEGARKAGWNAVFVGADDGRILKENMPDVSQLGNKTLGETFPQGAYPEALRAESTQLFLEWLVAKYSGQEPSSSGDRG